MYVCCRLFNYQFLRPAATFLRPGGGRGCGRLRLFLDVCMYVCPPYFNMTFGGIASVRLRCVFRVRLNEVGFPWLLGWLNEVGFPRLVE